MTTWDGIFSPIACRKVKDIKESPSIQVAAPSKHEAAATARYLAHFRGFGHYAINAIKEAAQ